MIPRIIESSMRLRLVVLAVAALLVVFGYTQLRHMPVDALPEFSRPYVEVQIEALGLSAEEVEAMITTPLEADMLNGTPWAKEIRSVSLPGMASITLVFEKGTDIFRARQVTQERLTELFTLPGVSNQITMINPVSSSGRVMEIGLSSDTISLIDMSVLARWTIAPRLMGLPGVANVAIWGERERQLQVQVNPERLRAEGLSLQQIIKTTGNSLWASPLSFLEASTPGTGGWIETPNQRLGVRHVLPIKTAADLSQIPIEGAPSKRLGDVTKVIEDHQPLIGDALLESGPSLMLVVEKFPWANTTEVTQEVETTLAALQPGMAGLRMDTSLFRPATFLEIGVANLSSALLIAGALVIVALFVMLFNWRSTLIGIISILVSLIAALSVLYLRDASINFVVIAGLMIGITVIIDDAVVVVENLARRVRQARAEGVDQSTASLIMQAAMDVRSPMIYATLIMILALVPVVFLQGVTGSFWQPLATSYMLALVASLVVAWTITPALSLLFLRHDSVNGSDSTVITILRSIYKALFGWVTRTPNVGFAVAGIVAVAALLLLPFVRQGSILPDFKEMDLVVQLKGRPNASHPAMVRISTLASRELRAIPGVKNVSAHVGRAIMSDRRTNINSGELWVSIDPNADYNTTVAAVKQVAAGYPGLSSEVLTRLEKRVREELAGTNESLVVRVYGEDMKILHKKAAEVEAVLRRINGVTDAEAQYPEEMGTLEIEVDLERAKAHGIKPGDARRASTSLVAGIVVGSLFEEQKVFDVVVWGEPDIRHSVTKVKDLLIDTPTGSQVRLSEVADVRIVPTVSAIHRDAVARRIDVTARVEGRDFQSVGDEIEDRLATIDFPLEFRAELVGEYAERDAAGQRFMSFAVAAAIGIFLLLQAFFRSWKLATAVFFSLPVALLGGVVVAFATNGALLSFGALVGLIGVLGIAVRNGITLISHYRDLEERGESFGPELVERATLERFGPIMTTALTIAVAFVPFVVLGSIAGLEIVNHIAVIVLSGLITSTFFSLCVIPAVYLRFGESQEPDLGLLQDELIGEEIGNV